ncbi:putative manganese-dependent inorganic diphosphatase [Haloimpatiens lingqiaonensis]|uniref:putative manganese-dependent inorganic diphosphatase n=1 Tax=Haloimpatiens lingqiaonensis TaxID=1380675 RepID=UPI0010FDBA38|nr:putative manganese-dependent inorganic diphosphatase [Haloimpatiens lingqiaonensis]
MKDKVYITGHKNPDSDSICSALAYAEFKNKTSSLNAIPVRLGELNRETKFILNYFNVEIPTLIETVKTQVSDLDIDNTVPISPDTSLKMAWSMMKKYGVKTLPVVDENDSLLGVVSLSNLTSNYMDVWDNYILSKSETKIQNILDTLCAKPVYMYSDNPQLKGKIIVAALDANEIKNLVEPEDIVICGNREDSQLSAIENGAALLIVTGNHSVKENIIELAKDKKTSIISTPFDTFTTSRLIIQSVPVKYVMTNEKIIGFNTDDFVDEVREIMLETRYRSYPVTNRDNKVIGTISRYHLISKNRKKVIIMDHNEKSQSVHGLEDAEVLEIIDHHRIADIQTGLPIYFRNEPVGSTSTIVASMFFENGIRPSKKIAGILCAAIISDTLLLKSPTSTSVDKLMLNRLSDIANIDIEDFAKEMFKAGTSLEGKTPKEIFSQDFKVFSIKDYKIGVSQVGTMYIESFLPVKDDILTLMDNVCKDQNFNLVILMVTDILNGGSELLVVGEEKDIVERAFNVKLDGPYIYLPDVLSRKKQIIPPLTSAINSLK